MNFQVFISKFGHIIVVSIYILEYFHQFGKIQLSTTVKLLQIVVRRSEGWTMPPAGSVVASGGGLSEGYGHDGPGVCLGDGQTEAQLKDMGMTGLASAWAMARLRPI